MLSSRGVYGLQHGLQTISRLSFIFSYFILLFGSVAIACQWQFSSRTRTDIAAILLFPALAFSLCHYVFENRPADPYLSMKFFFRSFLTLLSLLIPLVLLVLRYDIDNIFPLSQTLAGTLTLGLLVKPFFVFLSDSPAEQSRLLSIILHAKSIMWDCAWKEIDVDKDAIYCSRSEFYVNKESINLFQNTLKCLDKDYDIICRYIENEKFESSLSLLDIGGGEGVLTRNVVSCLKKRATNISEVVMLDPVDWETEYISNFEGVVTRDRIRVVQKGFQDFEEQRQYDLILASHSLYACFDLAIEINRKEILPRMLSLLKDKGQAIVLLASSSGRAYFFKKDALCLLYGREPTDMTSEDFRRYLRDCSYKEQRVDNLIDLTALLSDYNKGLQEGLLKWLSYFLRYDIASLNSSRISELVALLESYVMDLDSLPETEIEVYTEQNTCHLPRFSRVLPHKIDVFIFQASKVR